MLWIFTSIGTWWAPEGTSTVERHITAPICNPKGLGNQPLQTLGFNRDDLGGFHHNPVTE